MRPQPAQKYLTMMDIRDYYDLTLRQSMTFIKYRADPRLTFGTYEEHRKEFNQLDEDFVHEMTCICRSEHCIGSRDFSHNSPCLRILN